MVKRVMPTQRRSKHLCADAGYTGQAALQLIEQHGYIPHVKGRYQEQQDLRRVPGKKARRWVVEAAHSWFNPNNPLGRDAFVGAALAATDRTVDGVAIAAKAAPTKAMQQLDGR